ncbi:ribokinase [Paenibacillus filicis]|uniref:Ribokinase n=1 Tax=Paenibacillus gyeongsangnamensis TaxID=3388067 RepID=A0ABT4QFZ0_9BACL|nr:ribokinase [Paenibacillus filicis]MCZ8515728.1 ribokinase [Paenibacillus filicis]
MKPKITVVGSLNMDIVVTMERMPLAGETVSGRDVRYMPGGKGANQAVGCARLGAEVAHIGAVGDDVFGRQIADKFSSLGLRTEGLAVLAGEPTGIASIYHTPEDNCIAVVPGANAACTPDYVERHAEAIRAARLLLVQLEIPLPAVQRALELAREAGVVTVLNPAPAQPLSRELLSLADWVTPNETEFAALSGSAPQTETEWQAALQRYQAEHGPAVLVTRGAKGCSYLAADGTLRTVPAPVVNVVDTTGAGDALNAAFGFGLASGWSVEEAAAFAVKAASLSVTRFGAQEGMPSYDEVMAGGTY